MSFLDGLLKGFVRSAVNQVGRDTGRVVSNQIYGDSHSTPIRVVGSAPHVSNNHVNQSIESNELAGVFPLRPDGFEYHFFTDKWYLYPVMAMGAIILFPISWIYFLLKGFTYFRTDKVNLIGYEKVQVYKQDRRYKTGRRSMGYQMVRRKIQAVANPDELKKNRMKGLIYISIVAIPFIFGLISYLAQKG